MDCSKEEYYQEYYKEEEKKCRADEEDFLWKKQEEKFANLKYRSNLTSRVMPSKRNNIVKKFKQKIR